MKRILYLTLFISFYLNNSDDQKLDLHHYDLAQEEQEFFETHFRTEPAKQPTTVWTQPLIIDNTNHEFDNKSVVKFTENILYKPSPNYTYPYLYQGYGAAIIINKDNITIDLSGFSLAMDASSAANFMINNPTYGISIMPGVKNIKITSSTVDQPTRPGTITGFSGYAIYALGQPQPLNSYDPLQNYIKMLNIDNLLITHNISGMYISYVVGVTLNNTNITYNISPRLNYGINCSFVSLAIINNIIVDHNWSYLDMCGILLENTISAKVQNSSASMNFSVKSGSCYGIAITQNNSADSYANQILSCTANANLSSFTNNSRAVGFLISGSTSRNVINDCQSFISGNILQKFAPAKGLGLGMLFERGTFLNQVARNEIAYHPNYGIKDTAIESTTFFTSNRSAFNRENYQVSVADGTGGSHALPVLEINQNNLDNYVATNALVNVSILSIT